MIKKMIAKMIKTAIIANTTKKKSGTVFALFPSLQLLPCTI